MKTLLLICVLELLFGYGIGRVVKVGRKAAMEARRTQTTRTSQNKYNYYKDTTDEYIRKRETLDNTTPTEDLDDDEQKFVTIDKRGKKRKVYFIKSDATDATHTETEQQTSRAQETTMLANDSVLSKWTDVLRADLVVKAVSLLISAGHDNALAYQAMKEIERKYPEKNMGKIENKMELSKEHYETFVKKLKKKKNTHGSKRK
eukprot:Platyproteum_vivax@DN5141_c0_g1_i1.p1